MPQGRKGDAGWPKYGVRFSDGSVGRWFNGRTARARCIEAARGIPQHEWEDIHAVVQHVPGGEWERVEDGPEHAESEVVQQAAALEARRWRDVLAWLARH